jgi:hypothetical protein
MEGRQWLFVHLTGAVLANQSAPHVAYFVKMLTVKGYNADIHPRGSGDSSLLIREVRCSARVVVNGCKSSILNNLAECNLGDN